MLGSCDAVVGCRYVVAQDFDAVTCRTAELARALTEAGIGGRLGKKLTGLLARVDQRIGAARDAAARGAHPLARRRLASASDTTSRFLAQVSSSSLRGNVKLSLRATGKETRDRIAALRKSLRGPATAPAPPGSS